MQKFNWRVCFYTLWSHTFADAISDHIKKVKVSRWWKNTWPYYNTTVSQPRRPQLETSLLWKSQNLQMHDCYHCCHTCKHTCV